MTNQTTITETIGEIREALREYIEAAYHIGAPTLVQQRKRLLDEVGVTYQVPYLESTPRYVLGEAFRDLELPAAATDLLEAMSGTDGANGPLIFDPPYSHQATALRLSLREKRSLVVTTGTGSGKTESFLLPILGKLAVEAKTRPASFGMPGVRAILLYPMNALVNDQLGRLRLMMGDPRVVAKFNGWGGRTARFARYTSRTLYPGVRTAKRDQERLLPIERFYLDLLETADDGESTGAERAQGLITHLRVKGKWPGKPDLRAWYGAKRSRWQGPQGRFVRAVTLPEDAELLTRHEVLEAPPDVLITNYSMLEYMLMRPLERPIFDATRDWLAQHPDETFVLVVDEAHLYRGAAGAEVGLLLRRLRARLGLTPERVEVICTSASFTDAAGAKVFAAELSGKQPAEFETISGQLALRPDPRRGSAADAKVLASISLVSFYNAATDDERLETVTPLLRYRGVREECPTDRALHEALADFPPMSQLVNLTMGRALPLAALASEVFETPRHEEAELALTVLVALGSVARRSDSQPGLLPCRVHSMFRGLPGLWACLDQACTGLEEQERSGPVGMLFAQPRDVCVCGARVFELYTCRQCGSAYARAYTDDLTTPQYLWAERGRAFVSSGDSADELEPLDLCLEDPLRDHVEPAELDLITGQLNPQALGERNRQVFLRLDRSPAMPPRNEDHPGEFRPCGVCGLAGSFNRTSVQDHQTKGDEPFQALITRQLQVQSPSQPKTDFAPLQGRKVLTFSDSRQTAARLAPNLQKYSMRDVLRPLIVVGMRELQSVEDENMVAQLSLEHVYLALLVGAVRLGVRLRPELRAGESLQAQRDAEDILRDGDPSVPNVMLRLLLTVGNQPPPESLRRALNDALLERYYGLQALALGSLAERVSISDRLIAELPPLGAQVQTSEQRLTLVRYWLNEWADPGVWFNWMSPPNWWLVPRGVGPHSGKFAHLGRWLDAFGAKRDFERTWLPPLLRAFCEVTPDRKHRMLARNLTLDVTDAWATCLVCRATQRPFPSPSRCVSCGRDTVEHIDPDADPVFDARKGYYRGSTRRALEGTRPMSVIAAEHTAQLSAASPAEVFSKAEEHELLFQDIDLGPGSAGEDRFAIDVLSCTTTMEVGIDIGALSGVALRNMPPGRANYQQRSGRAGRRGSSVATVVAFGSSDTHDEHYFREPEGMISGTVDDPFLTLDNEEIVKRHVTAFLLQRYHQTQLPNIRPDAQSAYLFEVLGKVRGFLDPDSPLSRRGFEAWLRSKEPELRAELDDWIPEQLAAPERDRLLRNFVSGTLSSVDEALGDEGATNDAPSPGAPAIEDPTDRDERPPETGEERQDPSRANTFLLDRLLYKGALPRYAFPTDVVAFHVFDVDRSGYRHAYQYAPSQALAAALTQYAPGKEVWIDGKLWTSGALYSSISSDRREAWMNRRWYFDCSVCHFARTVAHESAHGGETRNCPACKGIGTFGEAKNWVRPPGFAHPYSLPEGTSPDDAPSTSYATRAKLVASGPSEGGEWTKVADGLRHHYRHDRLLVSNTGPRQEGYSYCTKCGLIEPTANPVGHISAPHTKPYPDARHPECTGGASTRGLVLGTDFFSDILLVSMTVQHPLVLRPGYLSNDVALRTLCEALTIAATRALGIATDEIQAEHRPALTEGGGAGAEAEIYLYDTLPGGAGFTRRIGEMGRSLYDGALSILEECPAKCDRSCYRCLRRFGNRFEHELLDRHVGATLLRHLLFGNDPSLAPERVTQAEDRLFHDVLRLGMEDVRVDRRAPFDVPGIGPIEAPILVRTPSRVLIVAIHGPLTPGYLGTSELRDAAEYGSTRVVPVDELLVSRNLPQATLMVRNALI